VKKHFARAGWQTVPEIFPQRGAPANTSNAPAFLAAAFPHQRTNSVRYPPPMHPTVSPQKFSSRLIAASCLLGLSLVPSLAFGQGCVIARGGGACAMPMDESAFTTPSRWQASMAFRWFQSHRHFAGAVEQTHRDTGGTEVINDSYFYDFSATYAWSKRVNVSFTVPYVYHDRSSLYEHLGNNSGRRFSTQASGLGDVRLSASYWLFNPNDSHKGNFSVGLGFKAPTGDYKAKDTFIRSSGPQERFVDSSIQPGDGGWGYTVEFQGFRKIKGNLSTYGNAFYLINPKERVEATGFSVPDAYMARGGFDYVLQRVRGLGFSLGGRIEGVPGTDLIGGNRGSRRPGFAVAVEPGVTYNRGWFYGTITVPILVHANRTTTWGSARAGDAAFADFTINSSFSVRL
jgi:hypothetical protein